VPGAITIDPAANTALANPVDDFRFFVNQQFLDVTGHEADQPTVDKLVAQLAQCNGKSDCLRTRRVEVSTSLLVDNELESSAAFLNSLYTAALGRRPKFAEFEADRATLKQAKEDARNAFLLAFVQRPEFKKRFAETMKPAEFVDAVLLSLTQNANVDLGSLRTELLDLADDPNGRVAVLTKVITQQPLLDAQYNQSLILSHYFAYLRRDPDDSGFATWLNTIKNKPLRDADIARSVTCGFLNSAEYQNRFGMLTTHDPRECN
jgi:hypothetical protein